MYKFGLPDHKLSMKILITILGLFNGIYMFLDGLFVLLKGKYIGPEKPGPWANLFYKLNIDVFKLGPLFVVFGLLWLTWLYGIWTQHSWYYLFGLVISIMTLWYLPIGTLFSIIILVILLISKSRIML
jgi:hypothetical protein